MIKKFFLEYFLLFLLLFLGLIPRFYKIDISLADHHSWRQADTAAVARNFIEEGWNFLYPKIDNMTYLHSPQLMNPERLFLVEPPVYQTIIAIGYRIFGVNEIVARVVSILFSLGSAIFLFKIVKNLLGIKTAYASAFFFLFLPYNIYYSRVILPEPFMVFLSLGFIYFFSKWLEIKSLKNWLILIIFGSLALTQKIYPFFLALPLIYWLYKKESFAFIRNPKIWITLLVMILPFILWRLWINQFPEGIPPNDWLLNQGNIRFKGAFFWWIFAKRLGEMILGFWGLIPFGLGLLLAPYKKEGWFFHFWFLAIIIYTFVFAAGNVTHDYYQIPFIPIISIFLAKGTIFILDNINSYFNRVLSLILVTTYILFMFGFSWYTVRDFYNIQGGVDLAGKAIEQLTPKNALVVTGDTNDATLLYNTNRKGWTGGYASYFPNTSDSVERVISMGASIYVTTKWNELKDTSFGKYMAERYSVISQSDQYIIYNLKNK